MDSTASVGSGYVFVVDTYVFLSSIVQTVIAFTFVLTIASKRQQASASKNDARRCIACEAWLTTEWQEAYMGQGLTDQKFPTFGHTATCVNSEAVADYVTAHCQRPEIRRIFAGGCTHRAYGLFPSASHAAGGHR